MERSSLPVVALIIIYGITLIALVFYLLALQKALKKCAPASRAMEPAKVWLILIPFFGLVWQFIVVMNIGKSLANEFRRLGIASPEPAPGQQIGLASCVCNCCIFIPLLGGLAGLAGLVLWIVYWVRVTNYSRLLDTQALTSASPIA